MWSYIIDGILILLVVISVIVGISKGLLDSILSLVGTGLALLAGGRYDGLVKEIDGKMDVPGIGFASGLERLVSVMEEEGLSFGEEPTTDLYIASIGENALRYASALARKLRNCGINVETDIMARSLKAQMKYADKISAKYSIVIGDSETENGVAELKNMENGEKLQVKLDETLSDIINI